MLDVQRCTNPAETKQRIAAAELHCDRLEAVLPKLRDHLRRAIAREQHAQWLGEYRERLSDYNSLAQQLNELDDRQDAIDAERHKLNNCADAYNQVAGAINRRADELREARQLPRMELSMPPGVVKDTGKKWGPPKIAGAGLAVAMAKSMVAVPAMAGGVGPYWNDPNYRQAQRDAVARQQAEIAAHYELMRREQEERINQEIQQQQQRGTR
jgi:hypothetical protein